MSVRIFTKPGTGKPWPTLTDARTANKNHDEYEGNKGTGGKEVVVIKRWEKTRRKKQHTHTQGNNCLRTKWKHATMQTMTMQSGGTKLKRLIFIAGEAGYMYIDRAEVMTSPHSFT
jgi:hypothetical protein